MERNLSQLLPVAGYAREAGVAQIFVHPVIRRDPVPETFSEELSGNRLKEQFRQELTKAVASAQQKHPEITFTFCNPQVSREQRLSSAPEPFPESLKTVSKRIRSSGAGVEDRKHPDESWVPAG